MAARNRDTVWVGVSGPSWIYRHRAGAGCVPPGPPAPLGPAVSPGELELPALARQLSLNTQARNPAAPVMTITGEDYAILDIESGKPRRLAGNRQYTDE